MADRIPLREKGKAPSLINAEEANRVIRLLNSLAGMQVSPQGVGKIVSNENNAVLDLSPLKSLIDQLAQVVQSMKPNTETTETAQVLSQLIDRVSAIENRLSNASISHDLQCDSMGNIVGNITLNI